MDKFYCFDCHANWHESVNTVQTQITILRFVLRVRLQTLDCYDNTGCFIDIPDNVLHPTLL